MAGSESAVITAGVAAVGWIGAYFLNGLREDRTKRLQLVIEHATTQLKEFYAPLLALTDQLNSLANVLDLVRESNENDNTADVTKDFYVKFFLPIHEQINEILKTKIHLMEGAKIPPSFIQYFEHYAAQKAYYSLVSDGIKVSGMNIPPYPSDFYWDVRKDFGTVSTRYENCLKELQHSWLSPISRLWGEPKRVSDPVASPRN